MGKLAKVILIFFSSLLAVILAAAVIIPLVVDLNDYKPQIEAAIKDKTGHSVTIEGDLNVSVFPWLGVSTGKISVSNAPGFTPQNIALISESDIKVKLMPLLSRKVEVSTIVLKGLELYLVKNKQGISNWGGKSQLEKTADKQTQASTEKEQDKTEFDINAFTIGGLKLENSLLSWNDQQAGQHVVVKDFNLTSAAIAFNQPIDLEIAFFLENSEPAVTEQLALSTRLIIDETLQKIQLKNLKLDSVTKGKSIPGGVFDAQLLSDIALDLQQQTLALKKIQLKSNTIDLTGDLKATQLNTELQYTGAIQLAEFSPKALLQQLQMDIPETTDKQVLQKLAMNFDLQGTKNSVALDNLKITLDDTKINGYTHITQFKNPEIVFNLAIDDINIDRYSAPKKEKEAKTPSSTATKVTTVTTLIPVETVRKLNLSGDLSIAKLKVAQLKMAGVSFNLQAKQGILRTKQSIKQLYNGSYKGQMTLNAKSNTPTLAFNETMAGVQIEPLLKDLQPDSAAKLKGTANITAKLNARGNTVPAIKSTLGGKLNFALHEGAIREFNLQKIIDIGRQAIKGKEMKESYANEQTLFSIIQGTATIQQGLVNNPDFLAESPTVEVKGSGTANLVNDALNYQMVAKIKRSADKKANRVVDRPIAINVNGTLSEPLYKVDLTALESMLTEKEKEKVDKFMDKREKDIDKALGKGSGKAVNELLKSFF
ncbi:MAG: AsmA family protein [Methyloprofundus sp.]|nr:AsmA family protein [Methyloprofundus sp.]